MSDGTPDVLVARDGAIGWVRLNRPHARNAIASGTRAELAAAFAHLDDDPAVRVVVLTGVGSAFCAGVDLREAPAAPAHPLAEGADRLTAPLESIRKPVLAAVNGPAFGGGFELVLAADLCIASTSARFALPEVKIGSLPGSGGTQRLTRTLPAAIANRMLFTGEPIDAQTALRYGLVSEVVVPEELEGAAVRLAEAVAAAAPLSLLAVKQCIRAAADGTDGLALERALWALLSQSSDRAEGRAAFREKRAPRFEGR